MSVLRALVDEKHTLQDVALIVRRAGVEHILTGLDAEELVALGNAGDELWMERTAYLLRALAAPSHAMSRFDGGAMLRAETKQLAYAMSKGI